MHLIDLKLTFVAIYFEGHSFETDNWIIDLAKSGDGNVWRWAQTNEEFLGTMRYPIRKSCNNLLSLCIMIQIFDHAHM